MEAFLTTLPPYVHEFLNKYPPTDVFNLLKELICFAVLYSDDRDRLNQSTEDFLKKREQQHTTELEPVEEKEDEREEEEQESVEDDAQVPTPESSIEQPQKPKLPNTFPEWWGHQEFQPPKKVTVTPVQKPVEQQVPKPQEKVEPTKEEETESVGPAWVSWDVPTQNNMRRMEKARSQIIPDLRSYLEEDHTRMSAVRTSSPAPVNKKRHSMLNLKTSTSPTNKLLSKTKENAITQSPVSVTPPSTLGQKTPSTKSTASPSRSASVIQPRQNAAMRARAEHARLQQEELEKKKSTPPPGSSISLKIKQRASSGIDWETIKKERRRTIAEQPTKK